ncbi:MAG TPA: uroporphyrinogen-III synthase [Gammaproteobacteria bacterium]|nr:uroporphyrinogen-III synthase [Gammaproteobacteria bacterium]
MSELSGVTVVVTRPAHQAEKLCQLIEAAGARALRFPVIDIQPPENPQQCQAQLTQLADYDLAIFVSANAVNATMAMLKKPQAWPMALPLAAVGKATAQALIKKGLPAPQVAPEPFNSEALLSLPELQKLDGKRILIFRGNSGRELLRNCLRERGAQVDYFECYQRAIPKSDTRPLYAAWDQVQAKPGTMPIVVTSNQGLQNLVSMIDKEHQPTLFASPLVVISERMVSLSARLGFSQAPVVAMAANDDAVLVALKTWAKSRIRAEKIL